MVAKPPDAAAGVPTHGDGGRGGPLGGRDRRPCVGERRPVVVRLAVDDDAFDRGGRDRGVARASRVGEQRVDDLLLLRARARGAARVRPRRAAGAATIRTAAAGRNRRHGGSSRHLPSVQRGPLVRSRLGRRDVDRHRLRARPARARGAALSRPVARVHADGRRRRRHPRARRHRDRVHGRSHRFGVARSFRAVRRRPRREGARRAPWAPLPGARRRNLGGAARVRCRAGRRRARDGSSGLRISGGTIRARACERAISAVPRAAHARARSLRARRPEGGDLAERAAAAALPPVDELPDRSPVRARERRNRHRRRLPRARPLPRRSRSGSSSATS